MGKMARQIELFLSLRISLFFQFVRLAKSNQEKFKVNRGLYPDQPFQHGNQELLRVSRSSRKPCLTILKTAPVCLLYGLVAEKGIPGTQSEQRLRRPRQRRMPRLRCEQLSSLLQLINWSVSIQWLIGGSELPKAEVSSV